MSKTGCARRALGFARLGRMAILFALIGLFAAVAAHAASYVYDANGRLRAVTTSTGDSAEYVYDALGNIYAVNTIPAGQLAIFAFTPNHGPIGQSVTISGQGFSATPSNNAVTFNGAPTTATSASTTELLVAVPAGATTGPISVQVGTNTATSVDNFVVTSDSGGMPPTIASFTPAVANAGTTISVTGSHFVTTAGSTQAGVDAYQSTVTPSSDTQLNFTVSSSAGSGPVTVTTPYGSAQSSTPLIVPPSSILASKVLTTTALTVDAPAQAFSINQAQSYAAATFQATAGQWLTLQVSNVSTQVVGDLVSVSIYDRSNTLFASGRLYSPGGTYFPNSLHLPRLAAGTYTMFVYASNASLSLALESDKWMSVDGATLSIPTTLAGQSKRILFNVNQNDSVGVGISNFVTGGNNSTINAFVYKPDGGLDITNGVTNLGSSVVCSPSGCDVDLYRAPQGGTYGLVVDSQNANPTLTMSYTASVKHNIVNALAPSTTASVNLAAGQIGQLTFTANAGDNMALQLAGMTVTTYKPPALTVIKPDGTALATASNAAGYTFNLASLPQTGTYTALVDPTTGAAMAFQATTIPSASAAVAVDGAGVSIPTTLAGQFVYFDFTANAGDNIGVGINNLTLTNSVNRYVGVYVYRPDGTLAFSNGDCVAGGCFLNLANLPQTGVYGVIVKPLSDPAAKMAFTATVSRDYSATLTANTTVSASLSSYQNGSFTFSANAGENYGLQVSGMSTTPTGKAVTLTVLKPDGTTLATASNNAGYTFNLASLPVTGTYTLLAQGSSGSAANLSVTLIPAATAAMTLDGPATSVPTTVAGQYVYLDFTANIHDNLGFGISNLTLTNSNTGSVTVYVYKPNGTLYSSRTCGTSGCDVNFTNLPVTGTYAVLVFPVNDYNTKMSFNASVSHDVLATLTAGVGYNLNLNLSGENAWLGFAGTAGTNRTLQITNIVSAKTMRFTVYKPDWTVLTSGTSSTSTYTFNLTNLPTTGTYTLFVDPNYGATATMTATAN